MRVPDGMSWAEAAAIPNVFVTAHDAIVTNAATAPGESVVITAGPSGAGTAAIQIARYIDANPVVATTRTPAKASALHALGAHEVVDTRDPGWAVRVGLPSTTRSTCHIPGDKHGIVGQHRGKSAQGCGLDDAGLAWLGNPEGVRAAPT